MDAPEIEKLKALALAAKQHGYKQWINPTAVLALIAEVERLRARFEYIEENAVTYGGGNGFEVRFFVPIDEEDIGSGIDAAIAASKEKA